MLDSTNLNIYTYSDFLSGITNIANQIKAGSWSPDYIVGIVRGGAIPAIYLSHMLKLPVVMLHWSSRDCHLAGGNESNTWIPDDVNCGKRVLIVDDIVDGGDTIREILNDWNRSLYHELVVQNIKIAALHYNSSQETIVDFYDQVIDRNEDSRWIVYPWEV